MAEKSTIARPYAQAAFDIAKNKSDLKGWSDMLQLSAAVVSDEQISNFIGNPQVSKDVLVDLVLKVCGNNLNTRHHHLPVSHH